MTEGSLVLERQEKNVKHGYFSVAPFSFLKRVIVVECGPRRTSNITLKKIRSDALSHIGYPQKGWRNTENGGYGGMTKKVDSGEYYCTFCRKRYCLVDD